MSSKRREDPTVCSRTEGREKEVGFRLVFKTDSYIFSLSYKPVCTSSEASIASVVKEVPHLHTRFCVRSEREWVASARPPVT